MARSHVLLPLLVVAMAHFHVLQGTDWVTLDHIVGGSSGWSLPPNATFYDEWTRDKTFVVGDKLVFMYTSGLQNVLEVSGKDFEDCTEVNVVDMFYAGPTVLEITKPGAHYYYSGVGTHCEAGQKLSINVSATPVPDPTRDGLPARLGNESHGAGAKSAAACRRVAGAIVGFLIPLSIALFI